MHLYGDAHLGQGEQPYMFASGQRQSTTVTVIAGSSLRSVTGYSEGYGFLLALMTKSNAVEAAS